MVTGQMSPTDLAPGEAGEVARRGRPPKTHMAVFSLLREGVGTTAAAPRVAPMELHDLAA